MLLVRVLVLEVSIETGNVKVVSMLWWRMWSECATSKSKTGNEQLDWATVWCEQIFFQMFASVRYNTYPVSDRAAGNTEIARVLDGDGVVVVMMAR